MRGEDINHVGEREGEDGALEQDAKLPNGWAVGRPTLACIPSIHPNSQGERRIDVGGRGRGEDLFIEGLPMGKHFDFH